MVTRHHCGAASKDRTMLKTRSLALLLALAACGGGQLSKPDTSREKAAQDLSECRHVAEVANRRDSDIDTDILASRGQDWERSSIISTKRAEFADSNRVRSGDIVTRCMIAKGYTQGG
jgi:hypothetical protein